ncbi:MAG TPA: hypothetical protein P5013_08620 [Methanoregula sp.]|nr:hypothetical protein [Methanoregula sp.]
MPALKRSGPELWISRMMFFILFFGIIVPVHAAVPGNSLPKNVQNASSPHYLYDPKTGALIGYGTTPSPEEQKIIDQIRGPGYSPFPAPTPLAMDIAPEQPVYAYGEPVKIHITLANAISDTFTFPDFPRVIEISTRPDGWNRGIVRTISHGDQKQILRSNNTTSTIIVWDQQNDQQIPVNPGVYYLSAHSGVVQDITPNSTSIVSSYISAHSEVVVQYPQGALAGTLFPDISVTDGGVTATLDSLVFNERGGFVNMTVYAPKPIADSPAAPGFSQVTAEYSLDNGTPRDFLDYSSFYIGNGTSQVTWWLAPIPCDTRKMHIAVTKFDPYRGHWNFTGDCSDISDCAVDNATPISRKVLIGSPSASMPGTTRTAPIPATVVIFSLCCGAGYAFIRMRQERS